MGIVVPIPHPVAGGRTSGLFKFPGEYSPAANGAAPNSSLTLPGAQPVVIVRFPLYFGWGAVDNAFRMVFDNFRITSSNLVTAPGSGIRTIRKAAFERYDESVSVPTLFAGNAGRTMSPGDFCLATDLTALPFDPSVDGFLWIRCAIQHQFSSQLCPAIWGRMTAASQSFTYAVANEIDQVYGTGPLSAPTGATAQVAGEACVGPSYIIGRPRDPKTFISVITIANSINTDGRDTDTPTAKAAIPIATGTTFWGRAASAEPTDGATPENVLSMSRASTTGANLHTTYGAGDARQLALYGMQFHNICHIELGINDLNANVPVNVLSNDFVATARLARLYGMRTIGMLLTPRTAGANVLADGSDQTYVSAFGGPGGNIDLQNQLRRSLLGGLLDAINPVASVRLAGNDFKWKAGYASGDLLHPEGATGNVPPAYETRASIFAAQYRAARPDRPTATELDAIYTLIYALVQNKSWHKLDALYILSAPTAQGACINLVNPFGPDTLDQIGSPAFTPNLGFTGSGTGSRLAMITNANALTHFQQDNACYGVAVSAIGTGANPGALDMGTTGTSGSSRVSVRTSGQARGRINAAGTDIAVTVASGLGITHLNRTTSNAMEMFKDGASIGSNASVSSATVAAPFTILSALGAGSSDTVSAAYLGAALTSGEIATLHAAIKACCNAINGGTILP